jgi:uncharacterized protein (DUF2267 family)
MVDYETFIATVSRTADVDGDEAERAACATLKTLSERITTGEAQDIAGRLPDGLRSCLDPDGPPETFSLDEFLRRVTERARVDRSHAERDAEAVFAALWSAVGPDEFADMRSQLPKDFDPLLDRAVAEAPAPAPAPTVTYDELLDRVPGLSREDAPRALEATLEALAARITSGQVDDLEEVLPRESRPALERGRGHGGGKAVPLTLDAFLDIVARAGGVDSDRAAEYARAAFAALREALPEKEWRDTKAQLPAEYAPLLRQG